MTDFSHLLQATLTPVALISGVGLLLLSMVNRYNHAIDRIRQLLKEKPARTPPEWFKIDRSVAVIYKRCKIMRTAILCLASSIFMSGIIVFVTVLEGLFGVGFDWLKATLLVASVGLVVAAAVMFVMEVTYSLHALKIELEE